MKLTLTALSLFIIACSAQDFSPATIAADADATIYLTTQQYETIAVSQDSACASIDSANNYTVTDSSITIIEAVGSYTLCGLDGSVYTPLAGALRSVSSLSNVTSVVGSQNLCSPSATAVTVSGALNGEKIAFVNSSSNCDLVLVTEILVASSDSAITADLSQYAAGVYTVCWASTGNSSFTQQSATVTTFTPISATLSTTNITCIQNGSATITITEGTGPFNVTWTLASGVVQSAASDSSTFNIRVSSAGSLSASVSSQFCPSLSASASISAPVPLTLEDYVAQGESCNGRSDGFIHLNVTGGSGVYTSTCNGNFCDNLASGNYTVVITDSGNCKLTVPSITISSSYIVLTQTASQNVTCPGGKDGSISVTPSGGVGPYTTSCGSNLTCTNLAAGFYTVTVTDSTGCSVSVPQISVSTNLSPSFVPVVQNVTCSGGNDGSITVGTATIQCNSTASNFTSCTNLVAGTYTVSSTSPSGCPLVAKAVVNRRYAAIVLSSRNAVTNTVGCAPGSAYFNATATGGAGDYTFTLGSSSLPAGVNGTIFNGFAAGTYLLSVADSAGCSVAQNVTVSAAPTALNFTINGINQFKCNGQKGGTVSVNITGGSGKYAVVYSPPGSTFSVSLPSTTYPSGLYGAVLNTLKASLGNYSVFVNDSRCAIGLNFTITQPPALMLNYSTSKLRLNVTGGTPPYTITNITATNTTFMVTDANLCMKNLTVTKPKATTAPIADSADLTPGGIAIAVLLPVAFVGVLIVVFVYQRYKGKGKNRSQGYSSGH